MAGDVSFNRSIQHRWQILKSCIWLQYVVFFQED